MIELAKHIASLLLENDCVIIPGFGGFIAHYEPSQLLSEEHLFLPPMRVVGFNPQLRINDGLLAQSYMATYGTTFPDAVKMLQQQSKELTASLHETGRMEFENVGELRYNIHGKYEFTPFDNNIITPTFYGLDSFKMQLLSELPKVSEMMIEHTAVPENVEPVVNEEIPPVNESEEKPASIVVPMSKKTLETKESNTVNYNKYIRYAASVAAIAIVALLSWIIVSPLNDSDVYFSEATVVPIEVLQQSMNDIVTHNTDEAEASEQETLPAIETPTNNEVEATPTAPVTTQDTPVTKPDTPAVSPKPAKKLYNVIVASLGVADKAEKAAQKLKQQGYPDAKAIVGDGKARVSVASFEVEADAYRAIHQFQAEGKFDAAWVLRR